MLLIIIYSLIMLLYVAPFIVISFSYVYKRWADLNISRKKVSLYTFLICYTIATIAFALLILIAIL